MSGVPHMVLDQIPVRSADVAMEVVEGELLLYHPQKASSVYLNQTAALVWGLCDGARSVGEIVRVLGDSYPEADASLTDEVLATLKQLQESGVLVVG